MQVELLCPETKNFSMAKIAIDRFLPRLKKFTTCSLQEYKTEKSGDPKYKISKESTEIFKKISNKDYLIVLDEKGKSLSTKELASKIESVQLESGYRKIIFLIGGPYGLSEGLKKRANLKLSLSPLTFNAEIAIAVSIEQIYRIYSVIVGHPYHNE